MHRSIPLLPFWLLCMPLAAAEPTIIELGGPRKASAAIKESENDYEVEVSLFPVRCFDPGLNRRLSQDKARAYAVEALTRHLGGGKEQAATIRHLEIVGSSVVDSRFVLSVRIKRTGVKLTTVSRPNPKAKPSQQATHRSSFTAKEDYQETLSVLTETMMADIPQRKGTMDEFYEAVGDAEEAGVARLAALSKEVGSSRWLLSIEREELLQAIAHEEKRFIDKLTQRVEKVRSEPGQGEE